MSHKRDIQPYWRPDFKIQSTLPDIKVVRTHFSISFIAIILMLSAACLVLQREYQAYSLRSSVATIEQGIQRAEALDQQHLKMSQDFVKFARSVEDLQRFFRAPLRAHELLVALAELKPEECVFSRVTFSESIVEARGRSTRAKSKAPPQMNYTIQIVGDVQELTTLTRFKQALEQSAVLSVENYLVTVTETMQQRNVETGIIPIKLSITLSPARSKGGKQ